MNMNMYISSPINPENKKIPDTDESCDWQWKHMRCEPYCLCSLQFQWGDYHLGRSCRRRFPQMSLNASIDNDNDENENHNSGHSSQQQSLSDNIESTDTNTNTNTSDKSTTVPECHVPPNTKIVKILNASGRGLNLMKNVIHNKLHRLNFVIKKRVDHVKDDMCTSFLNMGDNDDDGYDNTYSGDAEDNQDDLLFEKPVRALRKALKCGNRSGNFVSLEKEET